MGCPPAAALAASAPCAPVPAEAEYTDGLPALVPPPDGDDRGELGLVMPDEPEDPPPRLGADGAPGPGPAGAVGAGPVGAVCAVDPPGNATCGGAASPPPGFQPRVAWAGGGPASAAGTCGTAASPPVRFQSTGCCAGGIAGAAGTWADGGVTSPPSRLHPRALCLCGDPFSPGLSF